MLDKADAILERTRRQTAPEVDRYRHARMNVDDDAHDLRHHDVAVQLDRSGGRLAGLDRTVAALETWRRWAIGDTVNVNDLRDAVGVLAAADRTGHDERHRGMLGSILQTWAGPAGVDLQIADRRPPALQRTGIEIEP